MIDYNTANLDRINTILDNCSTEYTKCFSIVTMYVIFQKPNKKKIEETLKTYSQTRLSPPLKELIDFPILPLRTEIFKNLAFFTRDNQENYYTTLLLDLTYKFGLNIGEIEFHQKAVKLISSEYNDDERYPEHFLDFKDDIDRLIQTIENIRDAIVPFNNASTIQEPELTALDAKLQWNGDKTDLAELVWALAKSGQIIDTNTNKPVIIDQLTRQFETPFDIKKLDVDGLVSKRILNTYKPTDKKTFLDTLQRLMQERIARSTKK